MHKIGSPDVLQAQKRRSRARRIRSLVVRDPADVEKGHPQYHNEDLTQAADTDAAAGRAPTAVAIVLLLLNHRRLFRGMLTSSTVVICFGLQF